MFKGDFTDMAQEVPLVLMGERVDPSKNCRRGAGDPHWRIIFLPMLVMLPTTCMLCVHK